MTSKLRIVHDGERLVWSSDQSLVRVGVTGDTHIMANPSYNRHILRTVIERAGVVDGWLHTGDHRQDAQLLADWTGLPVASVPGNCDGYHASPPYQIIDILGQQLMLTHGHLFGVKCGLHELGAAAEQMNLNAVVFGHTHVPVIVYHGQILLFNPGSPSNPHTCGQAGFGIMEISNDKITPQFIGLDQ